MDPDVKISHRVVSSFWQSQDSIKVEKKQFLNFMTSHKFSELKFRLCLSTVGPAIRSFAIRGFRLFTDPKTANNEGKLQFLA